MGLYCERGEKGLEEAPTAPATDETKAPARRTGKGSMMRFARVSPSRTTVHGGVAVCQSVSVATHCDRSLLFWLKIFCNWFPPRNGTAQFFRRCMPVYRAVTCNCERA